MSKRSLETIRIIRPPFVPAVRFGRMEKRPESPSCFGSYLSAKNQSNFINIPDSASILHQRKS